MNTPLQIETTLLPADNGNIIRYTNSKDGCYPTLSILTPTLRTRVEMLSELMALIFPKMERMRGFEWLTYPDDGEISVGKKRQELVEAARGDYVIHCDDDDLIAEEYPESILKVIDESRIDSDGKQGPDMIGFMVERWIENEIVGYSVISNRDDWDDKEDVNGNIKYSSHAAHLAAVRREIALKVKFPDASRGEDTLWSQQISKFIKTERVIQRVLYIHMLVPLKKREGEVSNLTRQQDLLKQMGILSETGEVRAGGPTPIPNPELTIFMGE